MGVNSQESIGLLEGDHEINWVLYKPSPSVITEKLTWKPVYRGCLKLISLQRTPIHTRSWVRVICGVSIFYHISVQIPSRRYLRHLCPTMVNTPRKFIKMKTPIFKRMILKIANSEKAWCFFGLWFNLFYHKIPKKYGTCQNLYTIRLYYVIRFCWSSQKEMLMGIRIWSCE